MSNKNINDNSKKDKGLIGNEKIEEAIFDLQKNPNEEELKGADNVKSTFLADIEKIFEAALSVPQIKGIIINPWNRTIMLDKKLIKIIKPR